MPLTSEQYLRSSLNSSWRVADLIPQDLSEIRLIFVLESPHVEELATGVPVVGGAGESALRFLQGAGWTGQSLGSFVKDKHAAGDARLAVMNVSTMPLQQNAYKQTSVRPDLTDQEWNWLGATFRNSTARTVDATRDPVANGVGNLLLGSLQKRINRLRLAPGSVVVPCGRFARRYVRQLHELPGEVLSVPHPSRNQWLPQKAPAPEKLLRLQELFIECTM